MALNLPATEPDDVWGSQNNENLTDLDTRKAEKTDVYDKATADGRFVRTVNGTGPDDDGNVDVATGGGSSDVTSVNGKTGAVVLTASDVGARPASTNVPVADISGLAGVATTGKYSDLTGTPAAAIPLTQKGAASGVASLDSTGKLPVGQMPPLTASDVGAVGTTGDQTVAGVKTFTSPVAVADGADDGDALNKAQVEALINTAVPGGTQSVYVVTTGDDSDLAAALATVPDGVNVALVRKAST